MSERKNRQQQTLIANHLEYWEEMYQTGQYLNRWDYKQASQELVCFITTGLIPINGNCLDMGCGAGNEAIFLAQLGYRVTGIDFSTTAIEIAKGRAKIKNSNVTWINGMVTNTGLQSNSIDFINDRACFHHIIESERKQYASEAYRILKPGGCLLLRGSRNGNTRGFVEVNEEVIDKFFDKNSFTRGHILPITLIFDSGKLDCNIVVLTKK
ncbi:MAG: class I SAM-dependent methyltransferase [Bacteroidota bacterium]